MRGNILKSFLFAAGILFILSSMSDAAGLEVKKKVADLTVKVVMEKDPPVKGENRLEIKITDAKGKPVDDAKIRVEYAMPPMGKMPPMVYRAKARFNKGKYQVVVNFSMPGPWDIKVKIMRSGEVLPTLKFRVKVPKS